METTFVCKERSKWITLANLPALRTLPYTAMICLVDRDVLLWNSTVVKRCRWRRPGSDAVCVCVCTCKGSFRKIVNRGRKLMVKKFWGGITSLVPHTSHSVHRFQLRVGGGGARFWQSGVNVPLCPPK